MTVCSSCGHVHHGKKTCQFPVWTTLPKLDMAGNLPCLCKKNQGDWKVGILVRKRFWQSCWLGYHYSYDDKRLCINLLPWVTFWITRPGGIIP